MFNLMNFLLNWVYCKVGSVWKLSSKKKPEKIATTINEDIVRQKVELQKTLISVFKTVDLTPPDPPPETKEKIIQFMIDKIPGEFQTVYQRSGSLTCFGYMDISAGGFGITQPSFNMFVKPAFAARLREMGLDCNENGTHVFVKVEDIRKFCRYDKLKVMS